MLNTVEDVRCCGSAHLLRNLVSSMSCLKYKVNLTKNLEASVTWNWVITDFEKGK